MKDVNILTNNGVDVEKSLELFGEMSLYDETLIDFLNSINKKTENLKKYKENGDMTNYAIFAHSIKSDARYLGFTRLAEVAYQHELDGKANNYNNVCNNYDLFINEINRIISIVNKYLNNEQIIPETKIKTEFDKSILVVDDSDLIRKFVSKIFKDSVNIILANDGNEAINIIKSNIKIDGMLLDLNMPNCNGYEVLENLKTNGLLNKIPVALITGEDDANNLNKAFKYGIIDVLQKPFNEINIKNIVTKLLDLSK